MKAEIKSIPELKTFKFHMDMIPLIINDYKTMTRRPVDPQPYGGDSDEKVSEFLIKSGAMQEADELAGLLTAAWQHGFVPVECPYGDIGEVVIAVGSDGSTCEIQITDISFDRLQNISEDDCISEGFDGFDCDVTGGQSPYGAFSKFWDSIYCASPFNFLANPWVWVVEFKQVAV